MIRSQENLKGLLAEVVDQHWEQLKVGGRAGGVQCAVWAGGSRGLAGVAQ